VALGMTLAHSTGSTHWQKRRALWAQLLPQPCARCNAPVTADQVASVARIHEGGGGWSWILSDLKTLLETGSAVHS